VNTNGHPPLTTPYKDALPLLATAELEALRLDIAAEGVKYPVEVTEDWRVLDGHNRSGAAVVEEGDAPDPEALAVSDWCWDGNPHG
jgi:hypothetical protein